MTSHRQPLGQHFLRDRHVLQTIVQAAELQPQDTVLEIGPGRGVLTRELAPLAGHLTAIELDRSLAPRLQQEFAAFPHCRIVHGDFLSVDLDALFPKAAPENPIKVLGNLPYSITSPIFEKLLAWPGWTVGVFLIQREVGERMRAAPGSRTYGILSLAVQLFSDVERLLTVKPGAFVPPPRVTSMVVRLTRKSQALLPESQVPIFFDLVHGAFAHRRKTLANSLALHAQKPKSEIEAWLKTNAITPQWRAENLTLPQYVGLAPSWAIFRR